MTVCPVCQKVLGPDDARLKTCSVCGNALSSQVLAALGRGATLILPDDQAMESEARPTPGSAKAVPPSPPVAGTPPAEPVQPSASKPSAPNADAAKPYRGTAVPDASSPGSRPSAPESETPSAKAGKPSTIVGKSSAAADKPSSVADKPSSVADERSPVAAKPVAEARGLPRKAGPFDPTLDKAPPEEPATDLPPKAGPEDRTLNQAPPVVPGSGLPPKAGPNEGTLSYMPPLAPATGGTTPESAAEAEAQADLQGSPLMSLRSSSGTFDREFDIRMQLRVIRGLKEAEKDNADYELRQVLGKGGMGIVYAARQTSVDRTVAVKVIKSPEKMTDQVRKKFISEAVVTGDLEHPNIVPIYDLGADEAGVPFYVMKRVKGTPWSSEIEKKKLQENLDILMKTSDAVAFAHSRGVLHRDLKPENIMLGDFGVVLLMDWGLALSAKSASKGGNARAGTPCYMAPEMATGEALVFASDVYLLGAILYEIVTGVPPHPGMTALEGLKAAAENVIEPTDKSGELVDIALKAMATKPQDRYQTVEEFQAAVRGYLSHSAAVVLADRAEKDLDAARESKDYQTFAKALFGFQEAAGMWGGYAKASKGVVDASLEYATSAREKGDFDLGLQILREKRPEYAAEVKLLRAARAEREARHRRFVLAKQIGAALAVSLFVVITGAVFWINAERKAAVAAEQEAVASEKKAVAAKKTADEARENEATQKQAALDAKQLAEEAAKKETAAKVAAEQATKDALAAKAEEEKQRKAAVAAEKTAVAAEKTATDERDKAVRATKKEIFNGYLARIGLASGQVDGNAFDVALGVLNECPENLRHWEWRRLNYLSTQTVRSFQADMEIETVDISPDRGLLAAGGWGSNVLLWDPQDNTRQHKVVAGGDYVFAVAFSPDGKRLAIGTNDARGGYLKLWDVADHDWKLKEWQPKSLAINAQGGHKDAILCATFSGDGQWLLTTSYDRTAVLWDLRDGKSARAIRTFGPHGHWVNAAAMAKLEQEGVLRVVTASQDACVRVWDVRLSDLSGPANAGAMQPPRRFYGHRGPVSAVAMSADGRLVASGGYDRRILLWKPDDLQPFKLPDPKSEASTESPAFVALESRARVTSLRFTPDGHRIISGSQDNTVWVWDLEERQPIVILRGHAGPVQSCASSSLDGRYLISGSLDKSVLSWDIDKYQEFRAIGGLVLEDPQGNRNQILSVDLSADGEQILSATRDRIVRLWDYKTGKLLAMLEEGHSVPPSTAIFFAGGKRLLTAAFDDNMRIWDATTGGQLHSIKGIGASAAVAVSRDGKWILTGASAPLDAGPRALAKLWNAESGKELFSLMGTGENITSVAISPDDQTIFCGDSAGGCHLYRSSNGELLRHWRRIGRPISSAAFTLDGRYVLTASHVNVTWWDVATGEELSQALLTHPSAVARVMVSPDGRLVVTGCADGIVRVWSVADRSLQKTLPVSKESPVGMAFLAQTPVLMTATADGRVRAWDVNSGEEKALPAKPFASVGARGSLWTAAVSPSADQVLLVRGDGAYQHRIADGVQTAAFCDARIMASAHFAPEKGFAIAGSWDSAVRIWNLKDKVAVRKLYMPNGGIVEDAVYSPDGKMILATADDGVVYSWDPEGKPLPLVLKGHEARVKKIVFSKQAGNGGYRVLTASADHTARIWDAKDGKCLATLKGHTGAVLGIAVSADGKYALTASEDRTARLWDIENRAALTPSALAIAKTEVWIKSEDNSEKPIVFRGHTATVNAVAISKDGNRVLTGSEDGTARIWDIVTGKEVLSLRGHREGVTYVAYSRDESDVITASRDGTIIVYKALAPAPKPADPAKLPAVAGR